MKIALLIALAFSVSAADFYPVGTNAVANPIATNTAEWSSTALRAPKAPAVTLPALPRAKALPQVLTWEQRTALNRITSKGFIIGQKTLPGGRKELTWTNGKDTVVTTQKVERVQGKKSPDPRRAEIAAVKAERDSIKAERDAVKAENADLKSKKDKAVK